MESEKQVLDSDASPTEAKLKGKKLEFGVEDKPPLYLTLILGLQVTLSSIYGPIAAAFTIYVLVCGEGNDLVLAKLINTSTLMMGLATLAQVTLGCRLPIIQGSSFTYFMPIIAMMQTPQWRCPDVYPGSGDLPSNDTSMFNTSAEALAEPWNSRLATISGSLAVASVAHIVLGATGMVGLLMRYVGPLTVTPTVGMIGIGLFEAININCRHQWGITFGTVLCVVIFSLLLKNITVPMVTCSTDKSLRIPLFKLFSCVLAIVVMWVVCIILTAAGAFPHDPGHLAYKARADARSDVLFKASWFYMPYPGQWGPLQVSAFTTCCLFGSVIGSVIESIGDYYATARVSQVAVPPRNAINRGILIEGLCSVISGVFGAAHATTSYSNVMGFISYTGNASRRSWQVAALIFILCGMFGKFGAALAMVPQPIVGGLMIINFGMCFSIAISGLQYVDLESARNQLILGVSFVVGVAVPICYKDYPASLQTGVEGLDEAIRVFALNAPLLAGLVGFTLDNIIPGSKEERGMALQCDTSKDNMTYSDMSPYTTHFLYCISRHPIVRFIPFLPSRSDLPPKPEDDITMV